MKKVALMDTVFHEGSRRLCVGCVQIAKNRKKSAQKCEKSRENAKNREKSLLKSGNLWDDRQVMGWQVMGGCTVKSTAWGRNRTF